MRLLLRLLLLPLGLVLGSCGSQVTNAIGGACHGSETVQGMNVTICSEGVGLRVDQALTINSLCRSGALGAAANDFRMGQTCPVENRLGGCQKNVMGIEVVTWFYTSGAINSPNHVMAACPALGGAFVP